MRWAGHLGKIEGGRTAFIILTGTPAEKRTLGIPTRGSEDNIRMVLKEIESNKRNWTDSAQDRNYWETV